MPHYNAPQQPQQPQQSQQSRKTMPLTPEESAAAHDAFVLDEQAQVTVRCICRRCKGTGRINDPHVYCGICRRRWTAEEIAEYQQRHSRSRNGTWNIEKLPCGDPADSAHHAYLYTKCPTCGGDGHIYRWLPLDPLIDFALQWIMENYATISQAITARRGAM